MRLPLPLRKVIRPLIPDRVMARYRLAQHSRQARLNVDVFVDDPWLRRRWLAATPDTYRVRPIPPIRPPRADTVQMTRPGFDLPDVAAAIAGLDEIDAAVCVAAEPPRLVNRRRTEPTVAPYAIVANEDFLSAAGGAPPGDHTLAGTLARLRAAGARLGLLPVAQPVTGVGRVDPISLPPVVLISAVPMYDIGGGSRSAQLALELLTRGFHVTYLSVFGADETVDLGLRFVHPNLEQRDAATFDSSALVARLQVDPGFALVSVPVGRAVSIAERLQAAGFDAVYDLIDDWTDPALGGGWYRPDVEHRLFGLADVCTVSAPDLTERGRAAGVDPILIPNGVNAALFGRDRGPEPDDFPNGTGPVIGYHGSLYGKWLDWEAIAGIGRRNPERRVVLIGDPKRVPGGLPGNVHLLGLKPQSVLPDYVGRFDVGVIPFVVSDAMHAVSPLKVYEYLAMGVPVAAPPLRSLEGLDGVHTGPDLTAAIESALHGRSPDARRALDEHSWTRRVDDMLRAIGVGVPDAGAQDAYVIERPVTHYTRKERALRS